MKHPLIPRELLSLAVANEDLPDFLVLGQSIANSVTQRLFTLENSERETHLYICGTTGSGKSRFLENMIVQDIALGNPLTVIDPTGALYGKALEFLAHGIEQCQYSAANPQGLTPDEIEAVLSTFLFLNPSDASNPLRINPVEPNEDESTEEQVDDLLKVAERLFGTVDETRRLRQVLRNTLWVLVELNRLPPEDRPKLSPEWKWPLNLRFTSRFLSTSHDERKKLVKLLPETADNLYVKEYWLGFFAQYDRRQAMERLESTWNVLQYFLGDSLVRQVFDCQRSTFRIPELIRKQKSLFTYLPLGKNLKGSQLLGTYLTTKIQHAGYRRSLEDRKQPYTLYVDEFPEFADEQYAKARVTLRQYGIRMVDAHQSQRQPPFHTEEGQSILDTIKANSGVKVLFRLSRRDAEHLAPEMFELTQRKFHFQYKERSIALGHTTQSAQTVSFSRSESWSFARTRTETKTLGKTDSFIVQSSRGTNIGETLTEGIGSSVADGVAKSVSQSESKGVTEVWSKQHGISVTLGEGLTHTIRHASGFSYTETENESLAVQRGTTETHAEGNQEGESTSQGNNFSVTDSQGNTLTQTSNQSTSFHSKGGSVSSGESLGQVSKTAQSKGESYQRAINTVKSVTESLAKSASETTTTGTSMALAGQRSQGEDRGESYTRAEGSQNSSGHQKGRQRNVMSNSTEGSSHTVSTQQQTALSEAFSVIEQFSESMSQALSESVATARSLSVTRSIQTGQQVGLQQSQGASLALSEGEKLVFYTLEGERELGITTLQKLPRQHCVVSKTTLGAQELRTSHVPDHYYAFWDADLPAEILQKQRQRWGLEHDATPKKPAADVIPLRPQPESDSENPFGF